MMSIIYVFWMYVILFAVIGGMRGWAKELLVAFSVVLSLALNHVLRKYIPIARDLARNGPFPFLGAGDHPAGAGVFRLSDRGQHPASGGPCARERLQDTLFGAFLGGLNGYLVAGTILYYVHVADYAFQKVILKPTDQQLLQAVNQMMLYMPPQLLGEPGIYFAIILAFVFVLVVYI